MGRTARRINQTVRPSFQDLIRSGVVDTKKLPHPLTPKQDSDMKLRAENILRRKKKESESTDIPF